MKPLMLNHEDDKALKPLDLMAPESVCPPPSQQDDAPC